MKKTLLLSCLIALTSCAMTKTTPADANVSTELTPPLNTTSKVDIGVSLVYSEIAAYYDAIKLNKDYSPGTGTHGRSLPADIYVLKQSTETYDLYSNKSGSKGIAISKKDGSVKYYFQSSGMINTAPIKEQLDYEKTTSVDMDRPYFTQEFIYTGKYGNVANFLYREFNNDMARPAFSQELHFDLSESKIVGCKGLRIEIIKAGNIDIEYKVLQYFK